ncbi:MAG: amino acid ABC transporter permease [Andreesenia angusta]|nr:amino acid ABC transporter permease [Andreesenia angusta]
MKGFIAAWEYRDFFLNGLLLTIILSIVGIVFGTIIGVIMALMRISNYKVLNKIAKFYVDLLRGTPILVQLWMVYLIIDTSQLMAGFVALSINSGAYVAEIIRSGILSIPKGQMEAARSLGMNKRMAMTEIIMPQAVKNIVPVLGNEFIAIVKESAIVSVIGGAELMYQTNKVRNNIYIGMPPLMIAFFLYFILTFVLTKGVSLIERRLNTNDKNK